MASQEQLSQSINSSSSKFRKAQEEMGKVIVGQKELIKMLFLALLSDGHILLEGLPGLAKTLAVTTLAQVLQLDHKRIQFTPDLLPADLLGTSVYNPKEGSFTVHKGPIFTQLLLADEINRSPGKVQSALLEVMQERQITIAGQTFPVTQPYMVLATQNPIEHEGTYPLPEAQIDRFLLKVRIGYPSQDEEKEILNTRGNLSKKTIPSPVLTKNDIEEAKSLLDQIYIDEKILQYILDIVFATRYPENYNLDFKNLVRIGASPRASIALKLASKAHAFLANRAYVTPHDVKQLAHEVLRHRILLSYEAEAEGISSDDIIDMILKKLPVP